MLTKTEIILIIGAIALFITFLWWVVSKYSNGSGGAIDSVVDFFDGGSD